MLTPERHDDLRAENERLKKLLDDACNDEEELHARIDAILGKEVIDPPGTGRTPLAGDDGRLAVLLTALKAAWAERDYWRAVRSLMRNHRLRRRPHENREPPTPPRPHLS